MGSWISRPCLLSQNLEATLPKGKGSLRTRQKNHLEPGDKTSLTERNTSGFRCWGGTGGRGLGGQGTREKTQETAETTPRLRFPAQLFKVSVFGWDRGQGPAPHASTGTNDTQLPPDAKPETLPRLGRDRQHTQAGRGHHLWQHADKEQSRLRERMGR